MISVNNLTFSYKTGKSEALKNISFSIGKGEIFGFLGPSGAGKSTTQKILFRQIRNYSGEVSIAGKNLKKWDSTFFEHIGVGFELPNHYLKLSAIENLNFFGGFYTKKTDHSLLLEKVGLLKDANRKVSEFSKGMKMRLNFVRALIHDPEIVFLDEPTSGLDPGNARILKDIILELKNAGKTVFITTHNMHDAAELCDRVAFLSEGAIQSMGEPRELIHSMSNNRVHLKLKNISNAYDFPLDGLGNNKDFLKIIQQHQIESIHSEEITLEDVFIKVTGKSLVNE
ncbi:MAG TPA: ABC transporter ATP-binding protein [Flavobacteriales bacterium]|nr:ABC transporter ATP-binding protein [Flavobacteriales bacterium]HRE96676.1 ABC transporter ATP-binding protein [Flavobacteriales bacterium]HRJ39837.1 ABC transporter ATP-binding protein [Flavobacteriales bacterium]